MLIASKLIPAGAGLAPVLLRRAATIELDWDTRQKSRFDATDSQGRGLGVFLPRGGMVRGGDVLVAEDGSLILVRALPQAVLRITACSHGSAHDLLRAAYHLGNRHVPLQVDPAFLQLEPDHVLAEMLERMGLHVDALEAPFEPEAGAYDASRPAAAGHGAHDRAGHDHARSRSLAPSRSRRSLAPMNPGNPPAATDERLSATALLQLMRLASPSLPVGGFSYSEGLEAAVENGRLAGEAGALAWLLDQLELALTRSDLAVVAHAMRAWKVGDLARIAELNDRFATTRETREFRQQSEQMGRSLAQWLRHVDPPDPLLAALEALRPAPTWPVAFALAGVATGAPARDVLVAFAGGWAENMVQAAMKAVPLGQAGGQRVLAKLAAAIPAAVDAALALPFAEMRAFTPMLAIVSSQHEAQYSRLFRS